MKAYKIYDNRGISYSFVPLAEVISDEINIILPKGAKEIVLAGGFPAVEMSNGEITDRLAAVNGQPALRLHNRPKIVKYNII